MDEGQEEEKEGSNKEDEREEVHQAYLAEEGEVSEEGAEEKWEPWTATRCFPSIPVEQRPKDCKCRVCAGGDY